MPIYDPAVYRPGPVPGTLVCVLDGSLVAEDLADQHDTTHGLPAYMPGAPGPPETGAGAG